tara:strand:+ start:235 stop:450 length:216 start_codon:yes stop_codon:yes gene_type:complete
MSFVIYIECSDGWASLSIGKQGACSHHGGVSEKLSVPGAILLLVCLLFLFSKYRSAQNNQRANIKKVPSEK